MHIPTYTYTHMALSSCDARLKTWPTLKPGAYFSVCSMDAASADLYYNITYYTVI